MNVNVKKSKFSLHRIFSKAEMMENEGIYKILNGNEQERFITVKTFNNQYASLYLSLETGLLEPLNNGCWNDTSFIKTNETLSIEIK